MLNALV